MSEVKVSAEGLLFDMDGVLVSSLASVNRSWRKWAKHYGVPNADQLELPHGRRAVDIIEILKPGLDKVKGLALISEIECADVDDIETLAGARALLESLPRERWTIVTSATRRLLVARLKAAGLPQPEKLVCAEDVMRGKPDPEPYLLGAALLGVAPEKCVVVEDAPSGVVAGIAAGCRVLGVLGTSSAEELKRSGATWVVGSLVEVRATVTACGVELGFVGI